MSYVTDALKIGELYHDLENICADDNKKVDEYTQEALVAEAKYILSLYSEGGTTSSEELSGQAGSEAQKEARKQVRMLKNYIRKYSR